jgi:putative transposase
MVRLRDKRKLLWCIKQFHERKESQKWLSMYLGIKPRRFRQIYAFYKQTMKVSDVGSRVGRPKKKIPNDWKQIVDDQWKKHRLNAVTLKKVTLYERKVRIPHNTIHRIMLEKGFANEQESKQKHRKPWIHYERTHSLSAVQMDWHISKAVPGKQVCVVLDDASRKILSGGEFSNATAENSILLLKEALGNCRSSYNLSIRECISDHGSQFYGERRDKQGNADHAFENFLKAEGIVQILCGVNHPQTNGKVEKWFDFYEKHRVRYGSMSELLEWYNGRPHGSLNLRFAESPNGAFIRKLSEVCWLWVARRLFEG